jgi:hypothetical protein
MAVRAEEQLSARHGRGAPRRAAAGLFAALLLSAGCTTLDPFVGTADGPPTGTVYQVVATWNPEVVFAPDPVHGGKPAPGLAGRLYLFGPQIDFPMQGDGALVVDLYNECGDKPVMLEEWRIDHDTLQRLLRKDMIGWGYTLFLPWGTYKPDLQRVRLRACYQPAKGAPLFADNGPMTLHTGEPAGGPVAAGPNTPPTAAQLANQARAPAAGTGGLQVTRFPVGR